MGRNAIEWWVPMNKTQPFRQHLAARALRAAAAAGVPNPTVEFHSADGGKIVIGGAGAKPAAVVTRKPAAAVRKPVAAVRKPAVAAVVRKPAVTVVARRPAVTAVPKRGR
jgi:hypothetical protein